MSKHTPGPWYAGTKSVTASETENRLGLDVRIFGGNRDDNKANARLIAAAPEMYETLKALVQELSENDEDGLIEHTDQMINARAVIAKIAKAQGRHE